MMKNKFQEYSTDYISGVMSLRKPQKTSLCILDSLIGDIELNKSIDKEQLKAKIHSMYPIFSDFDRDFPSLTFALATGVGKTRLMGTFITYLYTHHDIKNFFVVAPNLTIYEKLINDLGNIISSKYVFKGVGCFKFPPNLICGDDYKQVKFQNFSEITIFVYNAQKFNSDDENRKFNNKCDNIGVSFFRYLSELDDLVVIMDEAHHYRNNATSEALDKIKPVLGLELTATPQIVDGKKVIPFKNVIYDYPLALSIKDKYTRTPFVLTRKNIGAYKWGDDQKDRIMINDGLHWHEHMKTKLQEYAELKHVRYVKPFMLIVCTDINHAKTVLDYIKSPECYGGKYANKVIEVDSKKGSTEKDENIQLLLNVEKSNNPIEIVVHVNMLKEGWDVNNLYTIVPLRSAYSRTLVEQTIGRGLRLPYGERTGDAEVDSVTMTAHDNFEKVVQDALKGDSIFKKEHIIYAEDIDQPKEVVTQTRMDLEFESTDLTNEIIETVFENTHVERTTETEEIVKKIEDVTKKTIVENQRNGKSLDIEHVKRKVDDRLIQDRDIAESVENNTVDEDFIYRIFYQTTELYSKVIQNNTIAIPRVIKKVDGEEEHFFEDFDLDLTPFTFVPISQEIMRENLLDPRDIYFENTYEIDFSKINPARVIVTILRDRPEIDYEACSDLLVKIIGQYFSSLSSKYSDNQIRNLIDANKYAISNEIYKQMMRHYQIRSNGLVEVVSNVSFEILRPTFDYNQLSSAEDLFSKVEGKDIRSVVFHGGSKWLTEYFKFDSSQEQDLAIACERDKNVIHWLRPVTNQFDLQYVYEGQSHNYEPDFVIETTDTCYLVEVKCSTELNDPIVLAKKERAIEYCKLASNWCLANGYKPWKYLLIPHDKIKTTTDISVYAENFLYE